MAYDPQALIESYSRKLLDLDSLVIALKGMKEGKTPARSSDLATAWVEAADVPVFDGPTLVSVLDVAVGKRTLTRKQATEIYAKVRA